MITGVNPYLMFDGNGREAIQFYEHALEAAVVALQTYGDLPENPAFSFPDEVKPRILHAHLKVGPADIMLSETFPGQPLPTGSQVQVAVTANSVEKSAELFGKLQEGGQVIHPLEATHFSPSYGQVQDKFGIVWHVSAVVTGND